MGMLYRTGVQETGRLDAAKVLAVCGVSGNARLP